MSIFTTLALASQQNTTTADVTTGLWSPNETGSLSAIYTSSIQVAISGEYYYDLYHLNPSDTTAEVQFSVAYGNIFGSGSPALADLPTSRRPTHVIYSQYRNVLLTSGSKFTFDSVESNDIYVINISRARMKQSIDPGNWQLGLSGSNGIRTFIDDSGLGDAVTGNVLAANVYNIRSGSNGVLDTTDTTIYGLVFADYGTLILYPSAISSSIGLVNPVVDARTATALPYAPFTGSIGSPFNYQYQHEGLSRAISQAMGSTRGAFKGRSAESVVSRNYWVDLPWDRYNYTNNPSYYMIDSEGDTVPLAVFQDNPLTYITTVGLYNNAQELLAVAKLSRPLQKSEDKSLKIRVRLDY